MPAYRKIILDRPEQIERETGPRYSITVTASRSLVQDENHELFFAHPYSYGGDDSKHIVFELPVTDQDRHWRDARTGGLITLKPGQGTHTYTFQVTVFHDDYTVETFTLENVGVPSSRDNTPISLFSLQPLTDGEGETIAPPAGWEQTIADAIAMTQADADRADQASQEARDSASQAGTFADLAKTSADSANLSASAAQASENRSSEHATAAAVSADNAETQAVVATSAANDAADSAVRASEEAQTATDQAGISRNYAINARTQKEAAQEAATTAATSAQNAADSAGVADDAAQDSTAAATRAETAADRAENAADAGNRVYGHASVSGSIPSGTSFIDVGGSSRDLQGVTFDSGRFTVPEDGIYMITAVVQIASSGVDNGALVAIGYRPNDDSATTIVRSAYANTVNVLSGSAVEPLTAGSTIGLCIWQNAGSNKLITVANSGVKLVKVSA